MSIKVQGNTVIDDNRNITNVANVSTTVVQIYANGVISNVQMSTTPANNDVTNVSYVVGRSAPAFSAFNG